MRNIGFLFLIIFLVSCKKENTVSAVSAVEYINLGDTVLHSNSIVLDLNKDNKLDLLFYIEQVNANPDDYGEFRVVPQIESFVLAKAGMPKVINKNDVIANTAGYSWSDAPVVLARRYYPVQLENAYWDGAWKNTQNKYLGLQLTKDNKVYNAWIRISVVNDKGRMILHDAGISKEPGAIIEAGQIE